MMADIDYRVYLWERWVEARPKLSRVLTTARLSPLFEARVDAAIQPVFGFLGLGPRLSKN